MEAEVAEGRILPEVQGALNLEVAALEGAAQPVLAVVAGGIVVVDEEERVSPGVALEHLEGGGGILPPEIIEKLHIRLRLSGTDESTGHEA